VTASASGFTATQGPPVFPDATSWNSFVVDIVTRYDQPTLEAYAVHNAFNGNEIVGTVWRTRDGLDWTPLPGRPAADQMITCMALVEQDGPVPAIYAATDATVYVSADGGTTFVPDNAGLPASGHLTNLFAVRYANGVRRIYAGTYGWSMWTAELPPMRGIGQSKYLYHYPFLYPDDAPRPSKTTTVRLSDITRPALNEPAHVKPARPAPAIARAVVPVPVVDRAAVERVVAAAGQPQPVQVVEPVRVVEPEGAEPTVQPWAAHPETTVLPGPIQPEHVQPEYDKPQYD
jgi:hypothetical protein